MVGKVFGWQRAMKGGIGTASVTVHGVTVGALVACNALGDVYNPFNGALIAGARTADGTALLNTRDALLRGEEAQPILAGSNTTIGVVATDAILTKAQAHRLAVTAHDGLARTINPVHTMSDGDTLFALGTGHTGKTLGMMTLEHHGRRGGGHCHRAGGAAGAVGQRAGPSAPAQLARLAAPRSA